MFDIRGPAPRPTQLATLAHSLATGELPMEGNQPPRLVGTAGTTPLSPVDGEGNDVLDGTGRRQETGAGRRRIAQRRESSMPRGVFSPVALPGSPQYSEFSAGAAPFTDDRPVVSAQEDRSLRSTMPRPPIPSWSRWRWPIPPAPASQADAASPTWLHRSGRRRRTRRASLHGLR